METDRFTELSRRHHRAVWAYAVRRLPAGTDAADVAAEVFDPRPATQWALYQDPAGSVVLVVQAPRDETPGMPALGHNIWSAQRLAEVATDPAFRP